MDKQNRLTRADEWQVGARYRWTKGRDSKLVRSVRPPYEVTFLGWHHTGRRSLVGQAEFQRADGSKIVYSPAQWRKRWVLVEAAPPQQPPSPPLTSSQEAQDLVRAIDFPHTRNGGRWRHKDANGRALTLSRACYYADQLWQLGMRDADVACLISDLYWDAAEELRLKAEADDALPPIEDMADLLAEEPAPSRVVINPANETATLHYAYPYEIDLDRIRTPADLLNWTMHLCQKSWMDAERLHEVVTAIAAHKGFDLHLH